ncbi:DNA recombination protein RmuC [Chlamydiifrater phoenicopteri]|uniref:DNA recombination protein RmuC n=1 Tax=Chlamydiifrater phoenicopteri TaxID=2681469 RepID=UPI001BCC83DB|nr:DNA recombination protein RmuC [Chlamydiifrater phoenicopteri]
MLASAPFSYFLLGFIIGSLLVKVLDLLSRRSLERLFEKEKTAHEVLKKTLEDLSQKHALEKELQNKEFEKILKQYELEKAFLSQSLESQEDRKQLIEAFSNKLSCSTQSLIKEIQKETKEYFSEKSKHFEDIVSPVNSILKEFKKNIDEYEKKQAEERGSLKEQISQLMEAEKQLEVQTSALKNILAHPAKRGRWGEVQLERILELSGMLKYCDYEMQVSSVSGQSRADAIIRLPKNRCLIIDSKAPLSESYLEQGEYDKDDMISRIKEHVKSLKTKAYWEKFSETPEFIILFLPGESLFNDTVRHAPELMDIGASSNVLIAGPSTLLALLKTVAHTWKQENLHQQIQEIGTLGKELYERLGVVFRHFNKLGNHLRAASQSYNDLSSSLQTRMLPTIKKFEKLDITSQNKHISEITSIDITTKEALPINLGNEQELLFSEKISPSSTKDILDE